MLDFKFLSNRLDLTSVEKVMAVLLKPRRFNRKLTHLCSSPILGTLLWVSCFVLQIKHFWNFLIFPYWGFRSPFEVKGESYKFLK